MDNQCEKYKNSNSLEFDENKLYRGLTSGHVTIAEMIQEMESIIPESHRKYVKFVPKIVDNLDAMQWEYQLPDDYYEEIKFGSEKDRTGLGTVKDFARCMLEHKMLESELCFMLDGVKINFVGRVTHIDGVKQNG